MNGCGHDQKKGVSRREMLIGAGKVAAGAAFYLSVQRNW